MFLRRAFGVAALVCVVSAPAAAQSPAAVQLKADLDQIVKKLLDNPSGAATVAAVGETTVTEAADGALTATLPELRLDGPDGLATIPPVRITQKQLDSDRVAFTVTPPQKITFQSKKEGTATLTIGSSDIQGTWRASLMSADVISASLTGVKVQNDKDETAVSLADLVLNQQIKETAPGQWGGPFTFSARGFEVINPDNKKMVAIDRLSFDGKIDNWRLADYAKELKKLGYGPAAGLNQAAKGYSWDDLERTPKLFAAILALFGPFEGTYSLEGLRVDSPAPDGAPSAPLTIKSISYSMGLHGEGATSVIPVRASMEGLGLPPHMQPPTDADIIPTSFKLDMTLEKLPLGALATQAVEMMAPIIQAKRAEGSKPGATLTPDQAMEQMFEQIGVALAPKALELIVTTPPVLSLKTLTLNAPAAGAAVDAKGQAQLALGTPFNAVANATVTLRGLDPLLERFKARQKDQEAQKAVALLTMVKGLANAVPVDGAVAHQIALVVGADGSMTANGMDLTALMGGTSAPPAAQPGAKPAPAPAPSGGSSLGGFGSQAR